jgi:hypothetical protein
MQMTFRTQATKKYRFGYLAAIVGLALAWVGIAAADDPSPFTITLIGPKSGAVVARTQNSPLFRWTISGPTDASIAILELSTDPTFTNGLAVHNVLCQSTGCPSSYRWRSTDWYLQSDACTYTPPRGQCSRGTTATGRYYWRVGIRGAAGEAWSSVSRLHVIEGNDRQRPHVLAQSGSGRRGTLGSFSYFVWDNSGTTRERFRLFRGRRLVRAGIDRWSSIRQGRQTQFFVQIPSSFATGLYRWCVTGYDHAGNHNRSCAGYLIT